MRATDVIIKKRGIFVTDENGKRILKDSQPNTKEEIQFMIDGYTKGTIPDYQISAWAMAIFYNGMTFEETGYLTDAMLHSGDIVDFHKNGANSNYVYVDKHSTGGVGDKISLPLAAIVAACGLRDPMMSGRALGHTGGTLDKLESIEGFSTSLPVEKFMEIVNKNGYSMIGQTKTIAPADKLLYALRDVTGTVESVPLITASILSKKVAEGSDGLVFDVKYGSGAFMKSVYDAELLATFLVKTAQAMGKKASAYITNMNTPLGYKIGNFLEIEETIDCLQGKGPEDVMEITYALGAEMLVIGGIAKSTEEGLKLCKNAVMNGSAMKKFKENVIAQGGDFDKTMAQHNKRRSPYNCEIKATNDGYISIDAYKMGMAGVILGVGRSKTTDSVCADAGMILEKRTGDYVKTGDTIMKIFGKNEECLSGARKIIEEALTYSSSELKKNPLIYKKI